MGIMDFRIRTRHPRTILLGWVLFSYYLNGSAQMYRQDLIDRRESARIAEEDAYYASPEGSSELAMANEIQKEDIQMKEEVARERRRQLEMTEEGRQVLEEERESKLLDLRYRETRIHYELARLAPKIAAINTSREADALQRAYLFASPAEQARLKAERIAAEAKRQEEQDLDNAMASLVRGLPPPGMPGGGRWIAPDGSVHQTRRI